jgi:hypothetical protein
MYGAIQRHLGFDRPHRENYHMAKKGLDDSGIMGSGEAW